MALHEVSANGLNGTIETRLAVDGDDTVCIVDLAPKTLGIHADAHPHTMIRGTVTYVTAGNGQCLPLEHALTIANGSPVSAKLCSSIADQLNRYAACELAEAPAVVIDPSRSSTPLATVLPMQRRAYA